MIPRTFESIRIGEGGLLRRLETAIHLTRLRWQIVSVVVITWVPVMTFSLIQEQIMGRREPIVHDPSVHVRLLVATPVFLILDHLFPYGCRRMLEQLVSQSFVPDHAFPRFERQLRRAALLADSPLPELLLALVSVGLAVGAFVGIVPAGALSSRTGLSPAYLWYAFTDLPLFQFLLMRSLWRWVIWVLILVGLSRIDLDMVATHPDRRGGISFLRLPLVGYCSTLLFAISSVVCAEWGTRHTLGTSLMSFKPLLLLFAIVGALLAFGPLLVFTPRLARLRRDGLVAYGGLATIYCRRFRREWIEHGDRESLLGTPDIGPLADLGLSFREEVERVHLLLFYRRDLAAMLVATLLPVVPVMLARVPGEDWRVLMGFFTGGRL